MSRSKLGVTINQILTELRKIFGSSYYLIIFGYFCIYNVLKQALIYRCTISRYIDDNIINLIGIIKIKKIMIHRNAKYMDNEQG